MVGFVRKFYVLILLALTVIVPYGKLGNVMTQNVDVDAGPSGVCRVPETGRTLALMRDGVEVERRRLTLDPGERAVIRM